MRDLIVYYSQSGNTDQVTRSHGKDDGIGGSGFSGDKFAFFEKDDTPVFAFGRINNKPRLHALVRGRD